MKSERKDANEILIVVSLIYSGLGWRIAFILTMIRMNAMGLSDLEKNGVALAVSFSIIR